MEVPTDKIRLVARICHEANRAYCCSLSDWSQNDWLLASSWQRDSAIAGVCERMNDLDAPISASHEAWLKHKKSDGWSYGPTKDVEKKLHPCMVPFDELPSEQRMKDRIFCAICKALLPLFKIEPEQSGHGNDQVCDMRPNGRHVPLYR